MTRCDAVIQWEDEHGPVILACDRRAGHRGRHRCTVLHEVRPGKACWEGLSVVVEKLGQTVPVDLWWRDPAPREEE